MSFVYLASPYSSKTRIQEEINYQRALLAFLLLKDMECPAFSPITHCHEVAKIYTKDRGVRFWKQYNKNLLEASYAVFILTIEHWKESVGIAIEVEWAKTYGKPLKLVQFTEDYTAISIHPISYEDVRRQLTYTPEWADLNG